MSELDETAAQAVAKMTGVPYASKENRILSPQTDDNLQDYVSESFARENLVLPLFVDAGKNILAVAMADPTHAATLAKLKQLSKKDIQPFVAAKASLLQGIDEFYT